MRRERTAGSLPDGVLAVSDSVGLAAADHVVMPPDLVGSSYFQEVKPVRGNISLVHALVFVLLISYLLVVTTQLESVGYWQRAASASATQQVADKIWIYGERTFARPVEYRIS